jgi:hypothetical protein
MKEDSLRLGCGDVPLRFFARGKALAFLPP